MMVVMQTPTASLRIAVLGVGRIGRMHAQLIASRVPGVGLAIVQDVDATTAEAVATELGVPWTTNASEVFASTDVDAVAICTSTDTHEALLIAAALGYMFRFLRAPPPPKH